MNSVRRGLLEVLERFFSGGIREKHDLEDRLRIKVINIVSVITIAITTFFGVAALKHGKATIGAFDLSVAFIFLATQVYLRKSGKYNQVKYFWVVSTGLLFILLFNTGGIEGTGHLWAYIFPLVAAFLLGPRRGAVAITAFLAGLLGWWVIDFSQEEAVYPVDLVLRFAISFSIVSFSACYYEYFRNETLRQLEVSNRELDRQIARLKEAEGALRKNQEELEKRVEARTTALSGANQGLQKEIAEHLQTAELLRASEEQYRLLFENSFDVILSLDDRVNVVGISPAVERILGYKPGELIGRPLVELNLLHPKYVEKAFAEIMTVLAGVAISLSDYEVMAKDGAIRVAQISAAPIRKGGNVVGLIAIARDVTAQREAETVLRQARDELEIRVQQRTEALKRTNEALEKASRAKSDFLATMSHELRTPLNHILGFTELVVGRHFGELNALQEEYLTDVLQSGSHLLSLIEDILDLSKLEAGKLDLEPTAVRLSAILEESLSMVKAQAGKRQIALQLATEDIPERIQADERKFKQIVCNLLSNAVKFTPDGGEVTLVARCLLRREGRWFTPEGEPVRWPTNGDDSAGSHERLLEIIVRDTGIGLRDEDLERIFDPFEQIDHSLSRRYQGTGLGLSVSRKLVALHGGKIWAESDGEGKGSRFSFIIPV